jgi:hypothetical protein
LRTGLDERNIKQKKDGRKQTKKEMENVLFRIRSLEEQRLTA